MRVGIVEVCEPNHYGAVNALLKTYASDKNNEVYVFTVEAIANQLLHHKTTPFPANGTVISMYRDESVASFLNRIQQYHLERIHINTLSRYYREFAQCQWQGPLYFSLHNVEMWYDNGLLNRLGIFRHRLQWLFSKRAWNSMYETTVVFFKEFARQRHRDAFIRKLSAGDYRLVVYSESHGTFLEKYVSPDRIIVFTFALYEEQEDRSPYNDKLRICIPGAVSAYRRDYESLFQVLKRNAALLKDEILVDLLGFIPKDETAIISHIRLLAEEGLEIRYYPDFIEASEYDTLLNQADIILGNVRVQINPHQKYGYTKETGTVYNMIRAAKPGILPVSYPLEALWQSCCLTFEQYDELPGIFLKLRKNPPFLAQLKANAKKMACHYLPEQLYKKLCQ